MFHQPSLDDIIKRIRAKSRNPATGGSYNNEDLSIYINEKLMDEVAPFFQRVNSTFFLHTNTLDNDRAKEIVVDIPPRSFYNAIHEIRRESNIGEAFTTRDIKRLDVGSSNLCEGYRIRGNKVYINNISDYSDNYVIRIWFYRRPSTLTNNYYVIQAIDKLNKNILLDKPFENATKVDVYRTIEPIQDDLLVSSSGNNLNYTGTLDNRVVVGDYLSEANSSFYLQMPNEAANLLVLVVCVSMGLYPEQSQTILREMSILRGDIQSGASKRNRNDDRQFAKGGIGTMSDADVFGGAIRRGG